MRIVPCFSSSGSLPTANGMKVKRRYSITIEDESRLEKLLKVSASPYAYVLAIVVVAFFLMAIGVLVFALTPAKRLLPGYLKDSERAATEVQHMRLDSLLQSYEDNAAYLANIMKIMNPTPLSEDTVTRELTYNEIPISADSLLTASAEERKFSRMMREREKYNISVIAPLAAESMMFSPVNEESIITEQTKRATKAEVILPRRSTVAAIADGTVISVSQSVREGGGTAVLIQHAKGFLSRCNRLGTVLIEPGDFVSGGQIIALTSSGNGRDNERISIEMWHNGNKLVPYDYLGDKDSATPRYPVFDE